MKGVTISPKGTETVHLRHQHQQEWRRQQELEEQREAEEIERLAAGELQEQTSKSRQVLSPSTGAVVRAAQKDEDSSTPSPSPQATAETSTFQGEWSWDMQAIEQQRQAQDRHATLRLEVDELESKLDDLEQHIQSHPNVPNLVADDFLDILMGDATEAQVQFNIKNKMILDKCKDVRVGKARVEKELAKKQLLINKVADAESRLNEAEQRAKLSQAANDLSQMRDLVKDSKKRVDEVQFTVSQKERQLHNWEQAVRAELFGTGKKSREKAEGFNIYSLMNETDGTVKRVGKKERVKRLKQEKQRLHKELKELARQQAEANNRNNGGNGRENNGRDGRGSPSHNTSHGREGEEEAPLSEEVLTEQVQEKTQALQKLKTVLAATKARHSALNAECAKNVGKIKKLLLEDSAQSDAQITALQTESGALQTRLNQQRHKMEASREAESTQERANLKALTESLQRKITAKASQLTTIRTEVERQQLELEDAKRGFSESSNKQADSKSVDARSIRALSVENSRLGERLKMLEASIGERSAEVESVADEAARVRKENRGLERKLGKLQVKRTKRGSSREALEQLHHHIQQQQRRNEQLLQNFRQRLASKQARVQACRDEADQYRQQINTSQGRRNNSYEEALAENNALKRRLQHARAQ